MEKKRYDYIDFLKMLSILMVVSLHIPLLRYDFSHKFTPSGMVQYSLRLLSEGVPFFVAINGFLMLRKNAFDLKQHIYKIIKVFLLLLFWAVIQVLTMTLIDGSIQDLTFSSVLLYVFGTKSGSTYTGALWFLQNLMGLYFFFPILWHVYQNDFSIFKFFFGILIIFITGIDLLELIRDALALYTDVTILNEAIGFCYRCSPIGNGWFLFYFCLGGMLYHYSNRIQKKRMFFIVLGIMAWAASFLFGIYMSIRTGAIYHATLNYGSIFMAVIIIGVFALSLPFRADKNKVCLLLSSIGKNTFGIYVVHGIMINMYSHYFTVNSWKSRLSAYLFVLASSYAFSILSSKIPLLKQLTKM